MLSRIAKPNLPALHAYRHLLREASYLPPIIRPFVAKRIEWRFRQSPEARNPQRIRRAEVALRFLRSANTGHAEHFKSLLFTVYGRMGFRRRQLMLQFRVSEDPPKRIYAAKASPEEKELLERVRKVIGENAKFSEVRKRDELDWWDTTKIRAFGLSQMKEALPFTKNSTITRSALLFEEELPKMNLWKLPTPPNVLRTKVRKGWLRLMNNILPPLPRDEWEALRDIVEGKRPAVEYMPASRRQSADSPYASLSERKADAQDWEKYLTRPTRVVEYNRARRRRFTSGLADETSPMLQPAIGVKRYTPRLLRHIYAKVWLRAATTDWTMTDPNTMHVEWGHSTYSPVYPRTMELFEDAPPQEEKKVKKRRRRG